MSDRADIGIRMVPVNTHDRTACGVLGTIRTMVKTKNYSGLLAAVEELQEMYERMESALYFYDGIGYTVDEVKRLEGEKKKLKREIKELRAKEYLIKIGKDPDPKEDEQDKYNQGYEAGLEKGREDPKKKDEDEEDA